MSSKPKRARIATSTERNPERWLTLVEAQGHGLVECETLTASQTFDEALLMGMRLREGVSLSRLAETGFTPSLSAVERLIGEGLLESAPRHQHAANDKSFVIDGLLDDGPRPENGASGHGIRATREGLLVLNEVVARLSASAVASAPSTSEPVAVMRAG